MSVNYYPKIIKTFITSLMVFAAGSVAAGENMAFKVNPDNLPNCEGYDHSKWFNCYSVEISNEKKAKVEAVRDGNGKWHGWIAIHYKNGNKILVEFIHGKDTGNVNWTYPNGSKYIGQTEEGKFHGKGIFTQANGKIKDGLWVKGKFIGNAVETNTSRISISNKLDEKINPNKLPICKSQDFEKKDNCWGREDLVGTTYTGEFQNGQYHGYGIWKFNTGINYVGDFKYNLPNGLGFYLYREEKFIGYLKNDSFNGLGIYINKDGSFYSGEWENGKLVKDIDIESSDLSELKRILDRKKIKITKEKIKENLIAIATQPNSDGEFTLTIETNNDTASIKINGEEQGGRADGKYSINKIARAGQETVFTIVATYVNGNTDTKTITVNRPVVESEAKFVSLNPTKVKKQPESDAVAIIIGIADYKNLPRADFANDDASAFYDYATRALGIKPENIKLLIDANADDVAIYQAFKTWLPSRVRSTTNVYVYYSGHGLPAEDGQELYLLPQRAHRDLIEKTAISQKEINGFLEAAKPRSVTLFLDSCYSGMARTGETLLASARPVVIKASKKQYPENFTVITASQADQISSSSPDLKHGIFSYYLMRGMQGEADANNDGRITAGEMHGYLAEQVSRQAGMISRKQEPQLVGDSNRVIVGSQR